MNLFEIHASGIRAVQEQLGDECPTLFHNGQLVKILPGGVRLKRETTPGGFSLDSDLQLTCLSADFKTPPTAKQTFKYPGQNGTQYSITSVTTMAGGYQLRINGDEVGKL